MYSFLPFLLIFFGCLQFVQAQQQIQPSFNLSRISTLANSDGASECEPVSFELIPESEDSRLNVVPPFYMLSFELGGIGRSDFLGTDPQNLSWTVPHRQGNKVLFYVVDRASNMSEPSGWIIQAGNTTNCHPTQAPTDFKLVTDSSNVATCDDVNSSITGGVKPYTVTVIADGLGLGVLNLTLGKDDDGFDYVNRVEPGGDFIIAISDSRGRWGSGTNLLSSVGSTDLSCSGKESGGTFSGSKSSNKGPIIGGVVAGVVFLLIGISLAAYFYVKRRKEGRLSATNRRDIPLDEEDVSPYVLPPDPSMQMQSLFVPSHEYVPVSTVTRTGTMSVSDASEEPIFHSQHVSRHPTLLSGEQVSSHSGSVYSAPPADAYITQPLRAASSETVPGARLQLASASVRPMTEKERVMAREEEKRKQKVVQHVDVEDILDIPPVYKERVGRPSDNSTVEK